MSINKKPNDKRGQTGKKNVENHALTLQHLNASSARVFVETVSRLLNEFASDESISEEERYSSLRRILRTIFESVSVVAFHPPAKAELLWSERDTGRGETPFEWVRRIYPSYVREGLKKIHFQSIDPPLYRALGNPHWIKKEIEKHGKESLFNFPTAQQFNERILGDLPKEFGDDDLERIWPLELQEQLRLLDLARRRARRKS